MNRFIDTWTHRGRVVTATTSTLLSVSQTKLISALFLLFVGACGGDEEAPPESLRSVRFIELSPTDGAHSQTLSGSIEAADRTRLSFQVQGRVQQLNISVGDEVEKGQLVAAVDPADYQLQLQEARASAAQAVAQSRSAAANYERVRALYSNQNASQQDLDTARANRDGAQSAAAAVSQGVRQLERQLEYCRLTAPAGGTIAEVAVESNEMVNAGQVVAVLQSGDALQVAVDVPESAINQIKKGETASVVLDSNPTEPLEGTISEVGVPRAGGAAFPIKVELPSNLDGVRSGMAASVTFSTTDEVSAEEVVDRFVVPSTAVGEDDDGHFIYVAEGDGQDDGAASNESNASWVVKRRAVTIGEVDGRGIEVLDGVGAGDRVIVAGVSRIRDGLRVRVSPPDPPEGFGSAHPGID